jgi:hypothetical protein
MSQHYFSTTLATGPATVMLGWNQPPGCVCMVVELHATQGPSPDATGEHDLYVDFSFPAGREDLSKELANYRRTLDKLELQIPESMWAQIDLDHATDAGPGEIRYAADGTFTYGSPQ